MKRLNRKIHKIFSLISGLSLIFQSITPGAVVFAQEITPEPTPTETIAPTPTEEISPTPDATPTIIETPTIALTPTEEATPSPTPEELTPTPTEVAQPTETGPPTQEQGQILDGVSTVAPMPTETATPAPTIAPEQPENGHLEALILDNVKADTLNLDSVDPSSSASITTDKADYAPTDTAIISGTGFTAGETYTLVISSNDEPSVTHEAQVTADENGSFMYTYQLDGNYRPNYTVELKSGTTIVATTTFTDSPSVTTTLSNVACMQENPKSPNGLNCTANDISLASVTNIIINDDGCKFPGDTVNFTANWQVQANATSRYNVGVWFATAGQSSAKTGPANSCSVTSLPSSPAPFFDGGSSCGGINSGAPGTISISMTAVCNPDENGLLKLPYCTSWQQNDNMACTTPTDAVPGTNSKCNCQDGFTVPIDVPPSSIQVVKVLSPSDDPGLFNLQVNGTTATGAANVGNGGNTGNVGVSAGTNSIGETQGTGTLLSNYTSAVVCEDKANNNVVSTTGSNPWTLSTAIGQNILCAITNTRVNNGSITIVKDAVPNDAQDFAFTTTGSGLSSFNLDDDGDATLSNTKVFSDLTAGTYSVSEDAVSGWTQTSATCSDGSPVSAIELSSGENVTCTFTNTAVPPKLTVTKNVINDNGGTKVVSDFPLFIDSTSVTSGVQNTVSVGSHTVSETPDGGYTSEITGDCAANGTITLALGDVKSCTITNDDKAPSLTLNKAVVKDNGGSAAATAWTLKATGTVASPTNLSGTTPVNSTSDFKADTYTLSETSGPSGYLASSWSCTNGITVNGSNQITLGLGQSTTCTIINDDIQPKLTVTKIVVGDSTPVSAFTLKVDSTIVLTGVQNGFNAGNHIVSEYDNSGGNFPNYNKVIGGDCASNGSITLALGDVKSCTITNTRKTGTLRVLKNVDLNGDGDYSDPGETGATDWQWQTSGPGNLPEYAHSGDTGDSAITVVNGNHYLTETPKPNFHQVSVSCPGITTFESGGKFVVSIDPNENAVCTFTNARDTGTVVVHKDVVNPDGGAVTDTSTSFTIKLDGGSDQTVKDGGTVTFTKVPTGNHTITENTTTDYVLDSISPDTDPNTAGAQITVATGQTDVYVVNKQKKATITVVKDVVRSDDSPVLDNHAFTALVDGADGKSFSENSSTSYSVNPGGPYTIGEGPDDNYTLVDCKLPSGANATEMNLASNDSVTVTCVNKQNPGTISGHKLMADGITGIAEWVIDLYSCVTSGTDCSFVQTTTTGAGGTFSFTNLVTGFYQVLEGLDPNYTPVGATSHDVTVTPGSTSTNNNFSNFKNFSISGKKYNDLNGNGNLDGDEQGIENWTINLYKYDESNTPAFVTSTTTDANGDFTFTNLDPAPYNYKIAEGNQSDWIQTEPTDYYNVAAQDGIDRVGYRFGNFKLGKITACKYVDLTGNGQYDSADDQPLENIDIVLSQATNPIDTKSTGEDGCVIFDGLTAGTYRVEEDYTDPDLNGYYSTNSITHYDVDITSGSDETKIFLNALYRTISGTKYNDENGNGTRDPGEPGLENWTIFIDYSNDGVLDAGEPSTTTSADGNYEFTGLVADSYTIAEELKSGWGQTQPTAGHYDVDVHTQITSAGNDFGNQMRGSITIRKDAVPDRAQNFRFTSSQLGNFSLDDDSDPTLSHEKVFTDVGENSYTITETAVSGWRLTNLSCDGDDNAQIDQGNRTVTINLDRPGENIICTFENTQNGSIAGRKYDDLNGNGNRGGSEPYLDGWTIHVFDTDWEQIAQMNTGDTGTVGQYKFTNLVPDTYYICEDLQDGWKQTVPDTDVTRNNSDCHTVTVDPGQNVTGIHFGNFELGVIQSRKYEDLNNDSTRDADEPYLNDWTIRLYKQGEGWEEVDSKITGHTGTLGQYRFENLDKGTYYLCEVLKDGWAQTDPSATEGYENLSGIAGEAPRCRRFIVNSSGDESIGEKHFGNIELGKVRVYKYRDDDGSGTKNGEEEYLEDWTMNLDNGPTTTSQDTNANGYTDFTDLLPGTYGLSEDEKPGYKQTAITCDNDPRDNLTHRFGFGQVYAVTENGGLTHTVTVDPGEYVTCEVGNQFLTPILTITKENNTGGADMHPGDSVVFTLTMTLDETGGPANNVIVTDLPAGGFTYRTGSWTATSSIHGALSIPEPSYHSPGNWQLGNMEQGEIITLSYIADIASDQQAGLYKDLAYAYGTDMLTNTVYANLSTDPQFYVGTDVNVVRSVQNGVSHNVINTVEGQVLGASTELPATGANTFWLYIAFALITGGISIGGLGWFLRRRYE